MKKTFVTMITGLLCTSLLACGNVNSDKPTTQEEVPVSQFDLQENDEQKKSAEAKDYLAQKESGLSGAEKVIERYKKMSEIEYGQKQSNDV